MNYVANQVQDDPIGRMDALVALARSAREDNVDDVLRTVVETVHSAAGFNIVVFNKYQPAWDEYEVVLAVGPTDAPELLHTRRSRDMFEEKLLASEFEIHPGIYFVPGSSDAWSHFDNFVVPASPHPVVPGGWDPEGALFIQLRNSRGEPLGILTVDEPRTGRTPDLDDLRLLRAICSHAEQSLENAHDSSQTERHRHRLTQLLEASERFSQCHSHHEVFETACEALIPGLGFERVAIYSARDGDSLPLAAATFDGVAVANALEIVTFERCRVTAPEVGGCWLVPADVIHGSSSLEPRSGRNGTGRSGWFDDVLLAPVFDGDGAPRLVFAIEDPVNHLRPTEIECELVRLLVEQADAALARVTFQNRLEYLVDHDASTGLLNRRALAQISSETSTTTAATVMICDIDHFKSVNDTHGHEVGDAVVSRFADLLRSLAREHDRAVRLGGDEFMVFLPETTLLQAQSLAERLGKEATPLMSSLVTSEVTLSIGLTQIKAGEHLADAMRRADRALYAAKKLGRNRIVCD